MTRLDAAADTVHWGYFDARLAEVEKFLHQPAEWSTAHGGTSRIGA